MAAVWKPAYLLCGDDTGRIAERRTRVRTRAEAEQDAGAIEIVESGDAREAAAVLSAMTLGIGRRFIIVDGCERWQAADIEQHVGPALAALAPETTVLFVAREEGKLKAPDALAAAVVAAGGEVTREDTIKAGKLPHWAQEQAAALGVTLDGAAAQTLVALVGERQQRLLRELEKLALEHGRGARIGVEEVEEAAAHSAERKVWALADAVVARDRDRAIRIFLELREQGESVQGLTATVMRRVGEVHEVAARLERGEDVATIKREVKGSPWALDHRIREARGADADHFARAVITVAELELATHGASDADPETAAIRAIGRITSPV